MCLHDHDYVMNFYFMVILHSITYGRPVIEVAYGEMLLLLHRGCMGDDSSGRVVGASTCCRPCWIYSDQHQCGLNIYIYYFWVFLLYKLTCSMFSTLHICI